MSTAPVLALPVSGTVTATGAWLSIEHALKDRFGLSVQRTRDGELHLRLDRDQRVNPLQASLTRGNPGEFGPLARIRKGDVVVGLGHLGVVVLTPSEASSFLGQAGQAVA